MVRPGDRRPGREQQDRVQQRQGQRIDALDARRRSGDGQLYGG